jgi:hypothetical protein
MRILYVTAALLLATAAGARAEDKVELVGTDGKAQALTAGKLESLAPREVTVKDPPGGESARYRGVPLFSVLNLAGVAADAPIKREAMTSMVRVEAADGYTVAFSLAELDPRIGATEVLLAFQRNGQPLARDTGPFRLVVPTDKRDSRWVWQVTRIRLIAP